MSNETDAYEVDPRYYHELGKAMDNRPFNGSTKFINFMLTVIALLLVAAVGGAIVMSNDVAAIKVQVKDLQDKVTLIMDGRINAPWKHDESK